MSNCSITISTGELYDRYSILQIKKRKIVDVEKIKFVNKELDFLKSFIDVNTDLYKHIESVNAQLWDIEDKIREKEKQQAFDDEFIQLARLVYKTNDERSIIKNKINSLYNSEFKEIKSYT